jgi:hypothetical protein
MLTDLLMTEHITILTSREPGTEKEIAEELRMLGISYSDIVITDKKAEYIKENNITIFFENQDEYFLELGEEVVVFKIREDGNFDFAEKKWIGSNKTTKMVD